MDLKQIGTRIRVIRTGQGLNQEDISSELGISTTAFSKIERGETNPSILRLMQIANVLKVDILNLFTNDNSVSSSEVNMENEALKREINFLNEIIKDKEEIITLLKNKK